MRGSRIPMIGLSLVLASTLPGCRRGDSPQRVSSDVGRRPNIIMLTVDTLRADHLSLYGYVRKTMPTIEAFARTAVVFDNAVVPRGSTRPSYSSMLTGLYPFHHGVRSSHAVLHDDLTTLPEVLKSAGYSTAGFIGNFLMVAELSGFNQGFDLYDDLVGECGSNTYVYQRTARNTLAAIMKWLDSDPPQPFFLFTNFFDPHGPYEPPERFSKLYRSTQTRILGRDQIPPYQYIEGRVNFYDYVDAYDGEIRYTDEALKILIDELERRGLWDDALVIFAADHGESFGEHKLYFDHHFGVWETTMHVPLAIRLPIVSGQPSAKRVNSVCSPMDLMPTILAYLGLDCETTLDGRSLLPVMNGAHDDGRTLFLEFPMATTPGVTKPDVYAVRSPTHKLMRVLHQETGQILQEAVFDTVEDRAEQRPIPFSDQDPTHRKLARRFDAMVARVRDYQLPFTLTLYHVPREDRDGFIQERRHKGTTKVKTLTEDQVEKLRSLGYVQ